MTPAQACAHNTTHMMQLGIKHNIPEVEVLVELVELAEL